MIADVNLELGGLLLDMASLADKSQRGWGYKRAAKAVLRLDRHITPLVEANTFRAVPGIGPTTDRIARELIHDGRSTLVERAIADAGREEAVARLRGFRQHFLSYAAVREILSRRGTPSRARYRGDFQMHSVWSDGSETLESIVEACLARDFQCAGMTDHSYGLPIAGGMSMEQAAQQHAAIDELNARYAGRFRMFKGIEANIRVDRSPSRSMAPGIGRTCTTRWPRARWSTAASLRSTATRTRTPSLTSSISRSPTPGSRAFRRIGS